MSLISNTYSEYSNSFIHIKEFDSKNIHLLEVWVQKYYNEVTLLIILINSR